MVASLHSFSRTQLPLVQPLSSLQHFHQSPTYHHSLDCRLLCSSTGQGPYTTGVTHAILYNTILRDMYILQAFTQGSKLLIGYLKII